jgi:hypothetical protein
MTSSRPALSRRALLALLVVGLLLALVPRSAPAIAAPGYEQVVDLTFPFESDVAVRYIDDYDLCRSGCVRRHQSTDLMVAGGTKVHAVVGGVVERLSGSSSGPPSYGWMIRIRGDDGRRYAYVHLGWQTSAMSSAYAPGVVEGARVERGQHIGWAGCSGSASCGGGEHLHLEIHDDRVRDPYGYHDEERINPFRSLRNAEQRGDHPDTTPSASEPSGTFGDVGPRAAHLDAIERAAELGLTAGCTTDDFCPGRYVTRGQAATFVERLLDRVTDGGWSPDPTAEAVAAPSFEDVAPNGVHAPAIDALTRAGVAEGCAPDRFCPPRGITRAELATLLARALDLPPADATFRDVPSDAPWAADVAAVAAAGITQGCGDGDDFCPDDRVRRSQLAALLVAAVDR